MRVPFDLCRCCMSFFMSITLRYHQPVIDSFVCVHACGTNTTQEQDGAISPAQTGVGRVADVVAHSDALRHKLVIALQQPRQLGPPRRRRKGERHKSFVCKRSTSIQRDVNTAVERRSCLKAELEEAVASKKREIVASSRRQLTAADVTAGVLVHVKYASVAHNCTSTTSRHNRNLSPAPPASLARLSAQRAARCCARI